MASHTFTVVSSLSVDDAFDRLIDLEQVTAWDEGVRGSVRIDHADGATPDSTGAVVEGSRFEVTVTGFDGTPDTVVYEITDASRPDRFVMVGENATFRATDELSLHATGTGSELTYVGRLELLGDDRPLTDAQLDSMFPKIAAVAQTGLTTFLNPPA